MRSNSLIGLLWLALAIPLTGQGEGLPPLTKGLTAVAGTVPAPALRLQNFDEDFIDLADYRGKVVVVNFWATWCPPCRREMASLEALYQANQDHDVEVLAVNIGEDGDTVFPFLGTIEPSPTFEILFDFDAASLDDWGVRGLPTTYVVRPDGTVAYRAIGGREFDHPAIMQSIADLNQTQQPPE